MSHSVRNLGYSDIGSHLMDMPKAHCNICVSVCVASVQVLFNRCLRRDGPEWVSILADGLMNGCAGPFVEVRYPQETGAIQRFLLPCLLGLYLWRVLVRDARYPLIPRISRNWIIRVIQLALSLHLLCT